MEISNVDTRRLRQFLAVLDAGGVREASRRIHIAQPALSRTMAELEDDLRVQLFVRRGRSMVATDAARLVAQDARRLLVELDDLVARARGLAGGVEGRLRLGTSPSATFHPLVPGLIRTLGQERPKVHIELVERSTAALLEAVHQREVDAAFVRPSGALPDALSSLVLVREPLFAALSPDHPLAGRKRVAFATLLDQPLLLPSPGLGSSLSALVDRLAAAEGRPLRVAAHAGHAASLVHLAAAGLGVALVPASLQSMRSDGVRYVRVTSGATLPLVLATHTDAHNPVLDAFMQLARVAAER
ncbi:MAG: LysR family transcriptional regulator [Sandaracinaceae bacterium]|nr:LysR family transcriptional regulator [Myxococcales bacterium]MCB9659459.1 LysR family transcriptional regulator [Sandaracinaceae bacterium]